MIRLFAWSLLLIGAALVSSLLLGFPQDPGYLLIAFGQRTFETSLFALLVGVSVVYGLLRLLWLIIATLNPWRLVRAGKTLSARRKANARSVSEQGMLSVLRGDLSKGLKQLEKAMQSGDASVLSYVAAAHAEAAFIEEGAVSAERVEAALAWLEKASEAYPEESDAVELVKAKLLLQADRLDDCAPLLSDLRTRLPGNAKVLKLSYEACLRLQDWETLEQLQAQLERNQVISAAKLSELETLLLQESLSNHANTEGASSAALQKQFKKSLPFLYENPELLLAYVRSLMQLDDFVAARSAIEKALASQWNEQLILRYGEWELGSPHKQLQFAEKHRANRSDDAALALTLARLSLRCELWGKAREYYDQALLLAPNAAGYAEYSKLLQGLGEEKLAQAATERAYAQAGLSDLSLALPKVNQPEP